MTGFYERDRYGAGVGQYSNIKRDAWQPVTFQSGVLVPLGQGVVIGGAWGIVAMIAGVIVCNLAAWPVRYGLLSGALAGVVLVAWQCAASVSWVRGAYLSKERYQKESSKGAAVERSTMTVEWVEHSEDGGVKRMRREGLPGTYEELAIVTRQSELSKRTLTRAGIGDDLALEVLAVLTNLNYITKRAGNSKSVWTSKGNAWRRGFAGGGGGGGAGGGLVVDVPSRVGGL